MKQAGLVLDQVKASLQQTLVNKVKEDGKKEEGHENIICWDINQTLPNTCRLL